MKPLIKQFGWPRLAAIAITLLPVGALPILGVVWLWQASYLLYWLQGLVLGGGLGYGIHLFLRWRENRKPPEAVTAADPNWPPDALLPWEKVEALAEEITPEAWPLYANYWLWLLGRKALELVARHYHPERQQPLLELQLPQALLIIERASRDLRRRITEHIPFSHQLTLGALVRANNWREAAGRWENVYRLGRAVVDPASVPFREFRRAVAGRIVGYGLERVQTWLLKEYVRKVGYYAIELYSGNLLLGNEDPTSGFTDESRAAAELAEEIGSAMAEPLNILVLGRANAGKSSLINGLFGKLTAAADVLPDTTFTLVPYRLEREGLTEALIFDSPGCDTPLFKKQALEKAVQQADLILWVSAAHRPDRREERGLLDRVRGWLNDNPNRHPAPILVVVSHIDNLRPPREWRPPYDIINPRETKEENIKAAVLAVAEDLNMKVDQCVPACLREDRYYNVDDVLWAVILQHQDEANKARFLRCLATRKRKENWGLLWRQLGNGGRFLLGLDRSG